MSDDPRDNGSLVQLATLAEIGLSTASLIHELRQPLFVVKGLAQLARAGQDLDETRLSELLDAVRQMEDLVDHYHGLGRLDAPETRFDVRDPVQRGLQAFRERVKKAKIALHTELGDEPLWVRGSVPATRQLVMNLLQNALDALQEVDGASLTVRVWGEEGLVHVSVGDNGPGIPDEVKRRLFEPFVTTKPPDQGTGLGLFIAQRLAEDMGGRLAVAHEEGTTMVLTLPRDPGPA